MPPLQKTDDSIHGLHQKADIFTQQVVGSYYGVNIASQVQIELARTDET